MSVVKLKSEEIKIKTKEIKTTEEMKKQNNLMQNITIAFTGDVTLGRLRL